MQKKADNQKYAEDKPKDCSYCYFWNSRKNGCSKEECYYRLLPEEPFEEKEETWCCEGCPYGRYSPCIGYCLQKILLEIKQKKAVREKEGGVFVYTGRENFCTDFKSIAAEAAQGDGTVPKAAKNFWKGAEKRNRISWETEHGKTESTQSGAF